MDVNDSTLAQAEQQLQDYVNQRLYEFARSFAAEVAPQLSNEQVDRITSSILGRGGRPSPGQPSPALPPPQRPSNQHQGPLKLVFRHDCLALGCRDTTCSLCQFNPERACERDFHKKYLVGDVLKARCGAAIRVELVDTRGRRITDSAFSNCEYEAVLVDGAAFKDRGGESRQLTDEEFRACAKPRNAKEEILLSHKVSAVAARRPVRIGLHNGTALLPDMQVTDSSEALLSGRRPPFRLVLWLSATTAAAKAGTAPVMADLLLQQQLILLPTLSSAVSYAVSEEFVVATRRVKQANKADVPLVDDPVSKIEHIGRETVRKLADMRTAALEANVDVMVVSDSMARIDTVGEFQALVRSADTDSQLRKALQAMLKLSKEKWDEAAAHAMTAVLPDFRRRVWYPPTTAANNPTKIGLVFGCKYGAVQLKDAVSLAQAASEGSIKVIAEEELDPTSLDIVRELKGKAVQRWSEPHHPGWGIFSEPGGSGAFDKALKAAATAADNAAVLHQAAGRTASSSGGAAAAAAAAAVGLTAGSVRSSQQQPAAAIQPAVTAMNLGDMSAGLSLPAVGVKRSAAAAGLQLPPSLSLPVFTPLAALGPSRSLNLRPGASLSAPAASVAAVAAGMGRDPQGNSQPPPANHLDLASSGSGNLLTARSNPAPPASRGTFPAAESGPQLGRGGDTGPDVTDDKPSVQAQGSNVLAGVNAAAAMAAAIAALAGCADGGAAAAAMAALVSQGLVNVGDSAAPGAGGFLQAQQQNPPPRQVAPAPEVPATFKLELDQQQQQQQHNR